MNNFFKPLSCLVEGIKSRPIECQADAVIATPQRGNLSIFLELENYVDQLMANITFEGLWNGRFLSLI